MTPRRRIGESRASSQYAAGLPRYKSGALAAANCANSQTTTRSASGGTTSTAGTGANVGGNPSVSGSASSNGGLNSGGSALSSAGTSGAPPQSGGVAGGGSGAGTGGFGGTGGAPVTGFPDVTVFEADACHDLDIAVSPDFVTTATNSGHLVFYKRDGSVDHKYDANNTNNGVINRLFGMRWLWALVSCRSRTVVAYLRRHRQQRCDRHHVDAVAPHRRPHRRRQSQPHCHDGQGRIGQLRLPVRRRQSRSLGRRHAQRDATAPMWVGAQRPDLRRRLRHAGAEHGVLRHHVRRPARELDRRRRYSPQGGDLAVKQHPTNVTGFKQIPAFPGIQQQGGSFLRNSGQVADWVNGHLWWSKAGQCADAPSLACVRMFDIDTGAVALQALRVRRDGRVALVRSAQRRFAGNMWTLMAQVSPTTAPSLVVAGMSASGVQTAPKIVLAGRSPTSRRRWAETGATSSTALRTRSTAARGAWATTAARPAAPRPTPAKVVHITTK